MNYSSYQPCPHCGLPNIVERRICKRCRRDIDERQLLEPFVATDITGHLYTDATNTTLLFLTLDKIEYSTAVLLLRTIWDNVIELRQSRNGLYLWLKQPGHLTQTYGSIPNRLANRQIPLSPFGYPQNAELTADLRRFALHLRLR